MDNPLRRLRIRGEISFEHLRKNQAMDTSVQFCDKLRPGSRKAIRMSCRNDNEGENDDDYGGDDTGCDDGDY